ncbi:hypothetical protein HPB51_021891 [Rhipicephalus microplus]|uniref:Uncharacterized protein n=1 Tax=Rhipicephalus microplus TaxID=6941 RepID=A0A9J6EJE1_RHIMP|nr:hypothetical protein HPB51_021891 [Rhipicephalus microplus]
MTAAVREEAQEARTFASVVKGRTTPHLPLARPVPVPRKERCPSNQAHQPPGSATTLVLPAAPVVLDDSTISMAQPVALPAVISVSAAMPAATSAPVTQSATVTSAPESRRRNLLTRPSPQSPLSSGRRLPALDSVSCLNGPRPKAARSLTCCNVQKISGYLVSWATPVPPSVCLLEKCKDAPCLVPGHHIGEPRTAIYVRNSLVHPVVPVSGIVAHPLECCAITIWLGGVDTIVASVYVHSRLS